MVTSTSKAVINVFHDDEFCFQDIIFQVENRLFKVPRQIFKHGSQVFRDRFSLPVPEGTRADGTSEDKPLKLDGITAIDFIRLLRYLFPTKQSSELYDIAPSNYGYDQKHPTFYTEEVFFEIDNTIFKFPKYYLRDSLVFERIFEFAALEDDMEISGAGTAQDPFCCSTIDKRALESFLALQRTAVYDQGPAIVGKGEWLDILKVSYFWKIDKLGKFAVGQLSKMQIRGVEKLKLAKRYDIQDKEWNLTSIRELIKTNIDFSEADVQGIGVDAVLRVCQLRGMASQRLLFPVSDSDIRKVFPEHF